MTNKSTQPKKKPYPRLTVWEAEKKFDKAIKAVSTSVKLTGKVPDDFAGYKAPTGPVFYANGFMWQFQIYAVCNKSDFINKTEVVPFYKGWQISAKMKSWAKFVIDWSSKS